ncbi:Flagellar hook-associated protein FliD [hydrothermal vent metagenome]|uniref:Filament cap protein n=1 Tax=hydrothermal vent metagenome TaxID=652676 RepID=A0A3B1B7J4_9ZZZZ
MPSITSAGVGTGLDVRGLVDKLVAAEGGPAKLSLDRKEAKLQAELSAIGTFKSTVSGFKSSLDALRKPDTFGKLEVSSSDEEKLAATATKDAQPGDYDIEILQRAQAHKLSSASLESDRLPLGSGSLTIQLGRFDNKNKRFVMNSHIPAKTINITEQNGSLRGIQEAINKADAGIRASVINDGKGYRLVLSSLVAGNDNSIRIKVNDHDGIDQDMSGLSVFAYEPDKPQAAGLNMDEVVAPRDAKLKVDGILVSRSSNNIDDVIEGLTLKLKPDSEASHIHVHVEVNTSATTESVKSFIGKYNDMLDLVHKLTGYNAETKKAGPLSGDASIRGIVNQIRRTLGANFGSVNSKYDSLFSIGIDVQRNGKLTLNSTKLQAAIDDDLQQVAQLFSIAGSSSDSAIRYLKAGDKTKTGAYDLVITRMASQGAWGGRPVMRGATGEIFPLHLDEGNNSFRLKVDGVDSQKITLTAKDYRNQTDLLNELQNQINSDSGLQKSKIFVEAHFSDNRLLLVSRRYGSNSSVEVIQADKGLKQKLGFQVSRGITGEDVAGTFNRLAGIGSGRILTGKGSAEGLKIEVQGGAVGERGQVFFSHGIGAQLYELSGQFLKQDGIIKVRVDGYSERIRELEKDREKLTRKLETSRKRYMKEYTALDETLGKMHSTSNFLSRQLGLLPGAAKQR